MPIKDNRDYRNLLKNLEIRAKQDEAEDESYIVEGYATTFDEPYVLYDYGDEVVKEQVDSKAFDNCDMNDVICQYDHHGKVYARTSNDTLKLSKDEHGLKCEIYLGGTEIGKQLYEEIKGGYITKMSFGFMVNDDKFEKTGTEDGKTIYLRTIKSIGKLYDVSAVSIPANDYTEISARSFSDGVIEQAHKEIMEQRAKDILKLKIQIKAKARKE